MEPILKPCLNCGTQPTLSILNCFNDGRKKNDCCQSVLIECPKCRSQVTELILNQDLSETTSKTIQKWNHQQQPEDPIIPGLEKLEDEGEKNEVTH